MKRCWHRHLKKVDQIFNMKLEKVVDTMKVYPQRRGGRVAEGAPLLREYAVYPVSRVRIPLSPPSARI